jgi:hypothetical protein
MHRRRFLIPFALATCIATYIATRMAHGTAQAQGRDTLVRVASKPRFAGVAAMIPEARIGMEDGPDEYVLGGPADILIQKDGSIVLLDWSGGGSAPIARRYDRNGKFISKVGAQGKGPGEYNAPTGMGELPDGRFLIGDIQNGRINVYSATGKSLATWDIRGYQTLIRGMDELRTDAKGTTYMRTMNYKSMREPPIYAVVRIGPDGKVIDTLSIPGKRVEPPQIWASAKGRGSFGQRPAYYPQSLWAVSPGGFIATGVSDRYVLDFNYPDKVIRVRRDVKAVPVSAAERREQRAYVSDYLRFYVPEFRDEIPQIPATKPFFTHLRSMQDGRVWVQLSTPSERYKPDPVMVTGRELPQIGWREPLLYDVYEPDGSYVGQVAAPAGMFIDAVVGSTAWGIVRDEDGIPSVVRYRIKWPSER